MNRLIVNRRARTRVVVLLALGGLSLAGPTLARGQVAPSGGGGVGGSVQGGSVQGGGNALVHRGNVTVSAMGNGIMVAARASTTLHSRLRFSGDVGPGAAGDTVEIERRGRETHWTWAPTAHGVASAGGQFAAVWPTNHIGRFAIRAAVEGPQGAAASISPTLTITVYRPALATIFGPGLYGRRTACGKTLRPRTLGVANRTLRCGMPVAIYYAGRTIVVPVIDRGPYAFGADWDLTARTARALGIEQTTTIAAVSLPSPPR